MVFVGVCLFALLIDLIKFGLFLIKNNRSLD
jgi:hypothetical protein